ncbi:MAG: hypothetical protein ACR2FU_25585 [Streptosporangiaceae bacterium]
MNDLEERLRAELRDRVTAAEPGGSDPGQDKPNLAGRIERQVRRVSVRRRWTAAALSAATVAAAIAILLGLLTPGPGPTTAGGAGQGYGGPLTDTAATPRGWAPVTYGTVQISVPARWNVETRGTAFCGGNAHGMVFAGLTPDARRLRGMGCGLPANIAAMVPASGLLPPGGVRTSRMINGLMAFPVLDAGRYRGYLVPALRVRVLARGRLAARILGTLTRSPLSVVLDPGRTSVVPRGWRWHDFGGIRVAAPATWSVRRDSWWGGCFPGIAVARTIELNRATRISAASCPFAPPIAGAIAARAGIVVGAGRLAVGNARSGQKVTCRKRFGGQVCILRPGLASSVLTLLVDPGPGRRPALVELGLAGSGAIPRAILDSIRAR